MFYQKIITLVLTLSFGLFTPSVTAKTILLVPQDDRPVSYTYTVSTAKKSRI